MKKEYVILVNEQDEQIGIEEKLQTHKEGKLHRAFSIFIFNNKGEMLIHQRAINKYHTGGLWSNTCCSHPRPGENTVDAIHRRLQEEMGFDCDLEYAFSFIYKVELKRDKLFEHELDHVFIGIYDKNPVVNQDEVSDFRWITLENLAKEIKKKPEKFTYWFLKALPKLGEYLKKRMAN